MSAEVRIGTSGWHYPSGKGTWNGVFYPSSRGRHERFDELSFYAEHFDTVEVNSTFYGQPRASVSRAWVSRTPPGFEFAVKLYQKFTHPRMYAQRVEASLLQELASVHGGTDDERRAVVQELGRPNVADVDEFKRGVDPLAASARLGPILAQFPPSFKNGQPERDYLTTLLSDFSDYALAVELRHASWSDDLSSTLGLLNTFGAAWVQIDEPKFRFSIRQNFLPNGRGAYYMRLHGRNASAWWQHSSSEDRYDYLYTGDEIGEFAETVTAARQLVKKIYLYTNNHFSAKSVANAAMIKRQLGEPLTGEYPKAFVERYPELGGAVKIRASERLI